jgi:DNA ligase-1
MRSLLSLLDSLTLQNTSQRARAEAIAAYLDLATPQDASWTLSILLGQPPERLLTSEQLRSLVSEVTHHSPDTLAICYQRIGNAAETLALLLDQGRQSTLELPLHTLITHLNALRGATHDALLTQLNTWWSALDAAELTLLHQLLTGSLRPTIPRRAITIAIAAHTDLDASWIDHQLSQPWTPGPSLLDDLRASHVQPAPTLHAPPEAALILPCDDPKHLPDAPEDHHILPLPDGLRSLVIITPDHIELRQSDHDLIITLDRDDPRLHLPPLPPNATLDALLTLWDEATQRPIHHDDLTSLLRALHKRRPEHPLAILAIDLLHLDDEPLTERPLSARLDALNALLTQAATHTEAPRRAQTTVSLRRAADALTCTRWDALQQTLDACYTTGHLGLLIRPLNAPYPTSDAMTPWTLWRPVPLTLNATLIYIKGYLRDWRSCEYTFGVWDGPELVPIAHTCDGLDNSTRQELSIWANRSDHVIQRFGDTIQVLPHHVFTLSYRGTIPNKRRKVGFELRDPIALQRRHDLIPERADSLSHIEGAASR